MKDGDWWRTWAFKIKPEQAKREGFDKTSIQGNLCCTDEYPGCPYCGSYSLVQCNRCQKASCWNGETGMTCLWCGNYMDNIVEATEKLHFTGDRF